MVSTLDPTPKTKAASDPDPDKGTPNVCTSVALAMGPGAGAGKELPPPGAVGGTDTVKVTVIVGQIASAGAVAVLAAMIAVVQPGVFSFVNTAEC